MKNFIFSITAIVAVIVVFAVADQSATGKSEAVKTTASQNSVEINEILTDEAVRATFWKKAVRGLEGEAIALSGNSAGDAWVLLTNGQTVHSLYGGAETGPQFFLQKNADGKIGLASAKNGFILTDRPGRYLAVK